MKLPSMRRGEVHQMLLALLSFTSTSAGLDLHYHTKVSSRSPSPNQEILDGTNTETSRDPAGHVLHIPLRRKVVDYAGHYYFLNVSIGTPGQSRELFVNTGSSDTWVYDTGYCDGSEDNHYQCYDPTKSKTSEVIPGPPYFQPQYPGRKFTGNYVTDRFSVAPSTLKQAEFGMLHSGKGAECGGLFALGFDVSEFGPNKTFAYVYPTILDALYNDSVVDSRAFGMYLNTGGWNETNVTGSLVIGGYDKSKIIDPLLSFAILPLSDGTRISIALTGITATIAGSSIPIWNVTSDQHMSTDPFVSAALDSGDMRAAIPTQAYATLLDHLNDYSRDMLKKPRSDRERDVDSRIDCEYSSANITQPLTHPFHPAVTFTFQSQTNPLAIPVPFSELTLPSPTGYGCIFALHPHPRPPPTSPGKDQVPYWLNLGSSVVSSMYVLVDYDEAVGWVARARHGGDGDGAVGVVPIDHRVGGV